MTEKIRHSGHFIDQKLKVTKLSKDEPSLFEILSQETRDKIGSLGIRAQGIRLNPAQDKLINALLKLLHEKSETRKVDSKVFYTGNDKPKTVGYGGGGKKAVAAIIRVSPTELYKAYLGTNDYSGADIKFINELLQQTSQIKYLIIYERKRGVSKGKGGTEVVTDRIEEFQSLYLISDYFEGLSQDETKHVNKGSLEVRKKKGELLIALNPLLTDQIQSKYVEYPSDINRRTMIAAGGQKRITECMIVLRDYMLREISAKRFDYEMNEETLLKLLRLEKYVSSNRRSLIRKRITDAIQFGKNLGLVNSTERVIGARGQWKYIFHLNQEFK